MKIRKIILYLVLMLCLAVGVSAEEKSGSGSTVKENEVYLYSTSWCSFCLKARRYFKKNNIKYVEYDVEKSEDARIMHQMLLGADKRPGKVGVPLFVINGNVIKGYREEALKKALGI